MTVSTIHNRILRGMFLLCLTLPWAANAAFSGRLPATPGGADYQAWYDDQLDVTWLGNATVGGLGDHGELTDWAANLRVGGVGGWRLASMDVNDDGASFDCGAGNQVACLDNEYGHLYWFGAGDVHGDGVTPTSPGPFTGLVAEHFWSSTLQPVPMPSNARFFAFATGSPGLGSQTANEFFGWAVREGDVGLVPLPPAAWLLGSALAVMLPRRRRRRRR